MKSKKKTDHELFRLLYEKITQGNYFLTNHAKQRIAERELLELEIINILSGRLSKKRKRNKRKDKYITEYREWNYCIEAIDTNENKIRIIFSFLEENMVVITVIRIN